MPLTLSQSDLEQDSPFGEEPHCLQAAHAPSETPKQPKTEAGTRTIPILPALRRRVVAWKLRSPYTRPGDLIIATADGAPVQERNLRRALDDAKSGPDVGW